ncbi:hypothetical protein [Hasllibacter sp. MH4015]|uniref:hypothetical protein n=1 Tax=Hasllibacter sp. MH4015 TaxID=2854029 RepID=UPI001CD2C968|nr:hypothetical protein [Hasllibacter sp. MH4015]
MVAPLLILAACGPGQIPTRATAERLCVDEARQADGISGRVGISGGSAGPSAGAGVRITSDIFNPRDEQEAFATCVERRLSGQPNPSGGGLTVGINLGGRT